MNSIWAYSRRVHLILLLVLLVLYVASWSTTYAFYTVVPFGGLYWAIAALGFVFLWLLRGLLALTSVFPAFHYGTLFVEWLAHLVKFSYQLYALVVVLSGGIAAFEGHGAAFVIVTLLIVLLVDITYFLLLFKYEH